MPSSLSVARQSAGGRRLRFKAPPRGRLTLGREAARLTEAESPKAEAKSTKGAESYVIMCRLSLRRHSPNSIQTP